MIRLVQIAVIALFALCGCSSEPQPSTTTSSTTSTSGTTSGTTSGATLVQLGPGCASNGVIAPIASSDGIEVGGVLLHEDGSLALRCYPIDAPVRVKAVNHRLAQQIGCGAADYAVHLYALDELPSHTQVVPIWSAPVPAASIVWSGSTADMRHELDEPVTAPFVCIGVSLRITGEVRTCLAACNLEDEVELDFWADDDQLGAPICDEGACVVGPLSTSPTPALGLPNKRLYFPHRRRAVERPQGGDWTAARKRGCDEPRVGHGRFCSRRSASRSAELRVPSC